jgi:peptide/nickel transport system permease protein
VSERTVYSVLTYTPATTIGVGLVALHMLSALFAPVFIPFGETQLAGVPLLPPGTAEHLLGTDVIGRDYFTRLVMGGRASIFVAMVGVLGAVVIGGLFAISAAYIGGLYDDAVMRIVDTKLSIPGILFVALFVTGFGRSVTVLTIVIGFTYLPGAIRIIRSQALTLVPLGYIKSARLRGESALSVIVRELTPNVMEVVAVEFAIRTSSAILTVSELSFLGLGFPASFPTWWRLLFDANNYIQI